MIKEYTKKQPSVKAMQFHGLRDIADVAELIDVDLKNAKVLIENQPDGYSIQFNDSAPVYLRIGSFIVKTGDDIEVMPFSQFCARYEEARPIYPNLIGQVGKPAYVKPEPWPFPADQRDYLAGGK